MEQLRQAEYYTTNKNVTDYSRFVIIETRYEKIKRCPWHYHENAHFAYTFTGHMCETSKTGKFYSSSGTLIYHNRDEPHRNSDYSDFLHGFQLELSDSWFKRYEIESRNYQNDLIVSDPKINKLFLTLIKESRINDAGTLLSMNGLLLQIFGHWSQQNEQIKLNCPGWVKRVRDILYDRYSENIKLWEIASEVNVHPVHISQYFPRYFHATFGAYLRKVRIAKSLDLLRNKELSLTDISYHCGFSDQSHFIRCFKNVKGCTPKQYRNSL